MTKTEHWQSYGETQGRRQVSSVIKLFKAMDIKHRVVKSNGSASQNRTYCSKSESKVGEFLEFGTPFVSQQGTRTDLNDFAKKCFDGVPLDVLREEHPGMCLKYKKHVADIFQERAMKYSNALREIEVVWIYGPPGTGKSTTAFGMAQPSFDQPLVSNGSVWFENYQCAPVLWLDELRRDTVKLEFLNRILDRYPLPIGVKGGSTFACWTKVVITSNWHPDDFGSVGLSRRITELIKMDTSPSTCQNVL